jgi:hypothetical protein
MKKQSSSLSIFADYEKMPGKMLFGVIPTVAKNLTYMFLHFQIDVTMGQIRVPL